MGDTGSNTFPPTPVLTVDPVTIRWTKYRLDTTIGAESLPTPNPGWPPPYQQPLAPQPGIPVSAGDTEGKSKKVFTKMGLSALNGWCGHMVGHAPSLLWTNITSNSTNMEDCRRIIRRAVIETSNLQAVEISKFYLTDDMLKDVIKLDFT